MWRGWGASFCYIIYCPCRVSSLYFKSVASSFLLISLSPGMAQTPPITDAQAATIIVSMLLTINFLVRFIKSTGGLTRGRNSYKNAIVVFAFINIAVLAILIGTVMLMLIMAFVNAHKQYLIYFILFSVSVFLTALILLKIFLSLPELHQVEDVGVNMAKNYVLINSLREAEDVSVNNYETISEVKLGGEGVARPVRRRFNG